MSAPVTEQDRTVAQHGGRGSDPRPDPTDPDTADPYTGEQPDGTPVENPSG